VFNTLETRKPCTTSEQLITMVQNGSIATIKCDLAKMEGILLKAPDQEPG